MLWICWLYIIEWYRPYMIIYDGIHKYMIYDMKWYDVQWYMIYDMIMYDCL